MPTNVSIESTSPRLSKQVMGQQGYQLTGPDRLEVKEMVIGTWNTHFEI